MTHPSFEIPYEATHFPNPVPFPLSDVLEVSWGELMRAAVTVGRWRADVGVHGRYSTAEAVHRVMCLSAYLDVRTDRLQHTSAHAALDPTEKGIVAYYLGMAAAKIFADRCLGVPWLMHISRYGEAWTVTFGGDERPDLFGCNRMGQWTVAEAKGRVRMRASLVTKMQEQKNSVATINGYAPTYRVGTATRFVGRQMHLRVIDPPVDKSAARLRINPAEWLLAYYAPVLDLIERSEPVDEDGVRYAVLAGTDLRIGLPTDAIDLLWRGRTGDGRRNRPPLRQERASGFEDGLPAQQEEPAERAWLAELMETLHPRRADGFSDGIHLHRRGQ